MTQGDDLDYTLDINETQLTLAQLSSQMLLFLIVAFPWGLSIDVVVTAHSLAGNWLTYWR